MIAHFDYEHFDDGKPLAHWQLVGAVDHADDVGHGDGVLDHTEAVVVLSNHWFAKTC